MNKDQEILDVLKSMTLLLEGLSMVLAQVMTQQHEIKAEILSIQAKVTRIEERA